MPMRFRVRSSRWGLLTLALCLAADARAVSIDWVTVGVPGNAADVTGFGAVAAPYRIGRTEVTNAQYAEFLNAKAASDPLHLYDANMAGTYGGIVQGGSPGSFTYATVPGREDHPVVYVSFFSALRFANWLHNGQGSGDTETGAYTLLGGSPIPGNGLTVARNAGASVFLPSADEWYKAAYFDPLSLSYTPDPFADGASGACEAPAGTTSHSANCFFTVVNTTAVGSYASSPSAIGTFDQGGNVDEWTEAIVGSNRVQRGGSWRDLAADLSAASPGSAYPTTAGDSVGFRVASVSVPEPATGLLVLLGALGTATPTGLAGPKRRR
jgi:formylglycine-generating enzyme required for sulfatase activity